MTYQARVVETMRDGVVVSRDIELRGPLIDEVLRRSSLGSFQEVDCVVTFSAYQQDMGPVLQRLANLWTRQETT